MNTVKILHCADIHIGAAQSFLGTLAQKRRYEVLMTFERIIDIAKENGVKIIAIAGDLFDSNKIEKSFVDAVLNKIAAVYEIKVVYAAGNHDPLDSCSPFIYTKLPDNFYILGGEDEVICFDDIRVRVYGNSFDFCYKKGKEKFSLNPENDDYINLMIMHGELGSDINSNYNAIIPDFIKNSSMDYIALGHIHKRTDIAKLGDTYFAYSGCPEGQGFDELDEKGIYLGTIGKDVCNLEFIPTGKRRHIYEKIDVSDTQNADKILEKIVSTLSEKYGEAYGENLYKIRITGELSEEFDVPLSEISQRLAERVFFAKIKDNTQIYIDKEVIAAENTLKGIFVKNMLNKIEGADNEQKPILQKALDLGLKAFHKEVLWNED